MSKALQSAQKQCITYLLRNHPVITCLGSLPFSMASSPGQDVNVISMAYGMQEVESSSGAGQEALDVSSSVDTRAAPQDLQEAATIISEHVQHLIPRVRHHLAADDR